MGELLKGKSEGLSERERLTVSRHYLGMDRGMKSQGTQVLPELDKASIQILFQRQQKACNCVQTLISDQ